MLGFFNTNVMERVHNGMVIRTSYGTGPYRVVAFTENCTCPSFMDAVNLGQDAPPSRPHYHFLCRKIGEHKGFYYVNGYDGNLNSVWGEDRVIVCAEETLFLTMCCGL